MDKTKETMEELLAQQVEKVREIKEEYRNKRYNTLIYGWNLQKGITKLRYQNDRDGYIEGIFKSLSKDLKITIETYSCNGFECDGDTTASYENFINRW